MPVLVVEISDNANCGATERVFHPVEAPRPVSRVCLDRPGGPAWCDVTGWTLQNTPCPALAQRADDSGDGLAYIVFGGPAGLRLRRADAPEPWDISSPRQWGEPVLIMVDEADLAWGPTSDHAGRIDGSRGD